MLFSLRGLFVLVFLSVPSCLEAKQVTDCHEQIIENFTLAELSDFLADSKNLQGTKHRKALSVLNAMSRLSPREKDSLTKLILQRLPKASDSYVEELDGAITEKRFLTYSLAVVHNPQELFNGKNKNALSFFNSFLKTRGALYSAKDFAPLVREVKKRFREGKIKGKFILAGSAPNGLAKMGSDLDYFVEPKAARDLFDGSWLEEFAKRETWALGAARIDAQKSKRINEGFKDFFAVSSKVMIEVTEKEAFLLLYPPTNRLGGESVGLEASGEPLRIPINFE